MSEFNDTDNPHTWRGAAWQVVFWKDGTASGRKEANRAVLETWTKGCGWFRFREYKIPDELYELEDTLRRFGRIFEAGIDAGKAEIRKVLGC